MPLLSSAPTSDNHTMTPPSLRPGGDPARGAQRRRRRRRMRRPPPGTIPASTATTSAGRLLAEANKRQAYPCQTCALPQTEEEGRRRMTCRRPPHHDAWQDRSCHARTTGTSSPPHDVQGTCAVAPAQRAGGAQTGCLASGGRARPGPRRPHLPATGKRGLVGLGRLERPTSRLSGVRSNQLSYRPERHPAGPRNAGGEGRANP